MSKYYVYLTIIVMAAITYIIRALPLLVFRSKIKNVFFKSVLTYAPYVTLSVLTFPSIFYCTGDIFSAAVGAAVAFYFAFAKQKLLLTVGVSCAAVFLVQLINL